MSRLGVLTSFCYFFLSFCLHASVAQHNPSVNLAADGIRKYRFDRWGTIDVTVANPNERDAELLIVTLFDKRAEQSARRIWVPGGAKRSTWCPILLPGDPEAEIPVGTTRRKSADRIDLQALVIDETGNEDELLPSGLGEKHHHVMLQVDRSPRFTATISKFAEGASDKAVDEVIAVARIALGHDRLLPELQGMFLPSHELALERIDQLVLSSDRIARDVAAIAALRKWVHAGGKLWIMLEQLEPATVEMLLGDSLDIEVVDRVSLMQVKIEGGQRDSSELLEVEEPLQLVRVLVNDVEVIHTVNGWPASFWRRVGSGDVLVTTLGAGAWMRSRPSQTNSPERRLRDRPESDGESIPFGQNDLGPRRRSRFESAARSNDQSALEDPAYASDFVATPELLELSGRFFDRAARSPEPSNVQQYMNESIGYQIVGPGVVMSVLGVFCFSLLASGVWLMRRRSLSWLAIIAPAGAAIAAIVFVIIGMRTRLSVPPTVFVAQFVAVEPLAQDFQVSGLIGVYNQESISTSITSEDGGVLLPLTESSGNLRRLIWTDFNQSSWQNVRRESGSVFTAAFHYGGQALAPVDARASFGPEGLAGSISSGPFEDLSDVIIATENHRFIAAQIRPGGSFDSTPQDVLALDQFVVGNLVTDEQRRRQAFFQSHFARDSGQEPATLPSRLMMYAWAKPLDMGFSFPEESRRDGFALLAIPLAINRPATGGKVLIPSPFVDIEAFPSRDYDAKSPLYDSARDLWHESRIASQTYLRFKLPADIIPLQVERCHLTIQIDALSRQVEIVGFDNDKTITLEVHDGPLGTIRLAIDRSDVLRLDEHGRLLLGLFVGKHPDESNDVGFDKSALGWQLKSVSIDVEGQTLAP